MASKRAQTVLDFYLPAKRQKELSHGEGTKENDESSKETSRTATETDNLSSASAISGSCEVSYNEPSLVEGGKEDDESSKTSQTTTETDSLSSASAITRSYKVSCMTSLEMCIANYPH